MWMGSEIGEEKQEYAIPKRTSERRDAESYFARQSFFG
jgi:hypothetical protein